jgi:hypothetical protein
MIRRGLALDAIGIVAIWITLRVRTAVLDAAM